MLKHRIIPIVLIDGFSVLKTINFKTRRGLGSPITVMRTYETRNVDEMVILDIDASKQSRSMDKWLVQEISQDCFMPLTIGGGIKTCYQIEELLEAGADKVSINTSSITDTAFIKEAVKVFGAQCIVISIDVDAAAKLYNPNLSSEVTVPDHIAMMHDCDVGEFLICDVAKEGTMEGPNLSLATELTAKIEKPVIYAGGVSKPADCVDLIQNANINAVGVSSIFHFTDYTPQDCRNALVAAGIPARAM
ncbi:HisA/HisF-related TIM barrel protein [Cognatishimia sp.]|uniref:HisA/HisF-related TIM barrel protein n=1 Tax=Cognatishimia sp. TaxID=2211648 RepID=UPI0035185606|nr:imidazole glycerol phosphate synthase subunit HisF [Cognatishimia sp.]